MVVVALVAVTVLPACGQAASSGGPPAVVAPEEQDLLGRWNDATGRELPDGTSASKRVLVVSTSAGSTTCTEDGTVFLQLAWPPGSEVDLFAGTWDDQNAPQFIRDTTGSAMETVGTSDLGATLPASAKSTGFQRGGNTISVDVKAKKVYVTRPDGRTEHWARLRGGGCG
jgi:hypothetical protein